MNQADIVKMLEHSRRLNELVEERLLTALRVSQDWVSASTPGARFNGTGEPRSVDKLDKLDRLRHTRLVANVGRWEADVATLTALILDTVPKAQRTASGNDPPEGACVNCWTDGRHFEPVSHYREFCRFCGDFKGTEGRVPPRALLKKRHAGQRVTTADVEKALGRSA